MVLLNHSQQVSLREAHGDVLDHQSRDGFLAIEHGEEVYLVVGWVRDGRRRWDRVVRVLILGAE
jgi:hypothetical protein